jgi:hypothetical protein
MLSSDLKHGMMPLASIPRDCYHGMMLLASKPDDCCIPLSSCSSLLLTLLAWQFATAKFRLGT